MPGLDFTTVGKKEEYPEGEEKVFVPGQEPVAQNFFDLDHVKRTLAEYEEQVHSMANQAEELKVVDTDSNEMCVTMMGQAKKISKQLNAAKLESTAPYREFSTSVNGMAKRLIDPLDTAVKVLKGKTGQFAMIQRQKQLEKEKRERDAIAKAQAELDKQAEASGTEKVELPEPVIKKDEKQATRTESGSSAHVSFVLKGMIIDPEKVPREYCVPDQRKIDHAVKQGVMEIAGVDIKEVPKTLLRS